MEDVTGLSINNQSCVCVCVCVFSSFFFSGENVKKVVFFFNMLWSI